MPDARTPSPAQNDPQECLHCAIVDTQHPEGQGKHALLPAEEAMRPSSSRPFFRGPPFGRGALMAKFRKS